MALRRFALLMLGIASGMLFAVLLLIFGKNTCPSSVSIPQTTEPVAAASNALQLDVSFLGSAAEGITLPARIDGTKLVAWHLTAYDGPFLEDGSGQEVIGIGALVVYNTGKQEVLQTGITLQQGGDTLCFYGENIPPGEAVLLLERNRRGYQQGQVISCSGWQFTTGENRQPSDYLRITDTAPDAITVTNITEETLQNIHLYYKSWLSPPEIYVGGYSRQIEISSLLPGESVILHPPYYAAGYTKILSVSANNP